MLPSLYANNIVQDVGHHSCRFISAILARSESGMIMVSRKIQKSDIQKTEFHQKIIICDICNTNDQNKHSVVISILCMGNVYYFQIYTFWINHCSVCFIAVSVVQVCTIMGLISWLLMLSNDWEVLHFQVFA